MKLHLPASGDDDLRGQISVLKQRCLLLVPIVLLLSMTEVYRWSVGMLGIRAGVLAGFLVYWLGWCVLLPLWMVGARGMADMLRDSQPRLPAPAWLAVVLLALPVLGGAYVKLWPQFSGASWLAVVISAAYALANGTAEEILWRGTYTTAFPKDRLRGWLYPASAFAMWHIAPTSVLGHAGQVIAGATLIGFAFGWIVWRTGTIRWTVIAHVLTDFTGLLGLLYVS